MAHPSVVINGVTYSAVPYVEIPKSGSGTATFYDTSEASAAQADILTGKTAFGASGEITGSMANNGSLTGTISTKAGTYTIPSGYTTGGSVGISSAEQAKIIAGNIRAGVTLLGQAGSSTVVDTSISSSAAGASTIVSGYKAYVNGSLITGTASMPTITQNSTTKVLSIS